MSEGRIISADLYLSIEQKNWLRHPRYGFDLEDFIDDSPTQRAVRDAVQNLSEFSDVVNEIPGGGLNRHASLKHHEHTLYDDAQRLLGSHYPDIMENLAVGFLPTGIVNGCVFRDDGRGNFLDKYLVVINHGLFFATSRLCDALTGEILQGDLAQYASCGARAFEDAVKRYLTPTREVIEQTHFDWNLPDEVYGEFRVRSGALHAIMLQFITLHEIAHIVRGDVESKNGIKRFSVVCDTTASQNSEVVEYRRDIDQAKENWSCEFNADEFAIRWLCDWKSGRQSCWANVAQVYLMFGWLAIIEEIRGRPICPYHPPAIERQSAIRTKANALATSGSQEDYFGFIDSKIRYWTSKVDIQKP